MTFEQIPSTELYLPQNLINGYYRVVDSTQTYLVLVLSLTQGNYISTFTSEGNFTDEDVGLDLCKKLYPNAKDFKLCGIQGACTYLMQT